MSYNLSGMNFHKIRSKTKYNSPYENNNIDLRSSSAFDQVLQPSSKPNLIDGQANKLHNYIPKLIKNKINLSNQDIVLEI